MKFDKIELQNGSPVTIGIDETYFMMNNNVSMVLISLALVYNSSNTENRIQELHKNMNEDLNYLNEKKCNKVFHANEDSDTVKSKFIDELFKLDFEVDCHFKSIPNDQDCEFVKNELIVSALSSILRKKEILNMDIYIEESSKINIKLVNRLNAYRNKQKLKYNIKTENLNIQIVKKGAFHVLSISDYFCYYYQKLMKENGSLKTFEENFFKNLIRKTRFISIPEKKKYINTKTNFNLDELKQCLEGLNIGI